MVCFYLKKKINVIFVLFDPCKGQHEHLSIKIFCLVEEVTFSQVLNPQLNIFGMLTILSKPSMV